MKTLSPHRQQGAVLIVALVILAVVTVLGVAGMRNSTLELRMATSLRDRTMAFQAAESALARVEQLIYSQPYGLGSFNTENCPDRGVTLEGRALTPRRGCFDANCSNGLCFAGTFANAEVLTECQLNNADEPVELWRQEAIWSGNNPREWVIPVSKPTAGDGPDTQDITARYLVEFMCFVPRSTARVFDEEEMLPLYRVTVRAATALNRAEVILQSTFEGPSL